MARGLKVRGLVLLLVILVARETVRAQNFSDSFAGQQVMTGAAALVTGSNTNATVEPGEPRHAGKIGGHSLWISWLAPADGLVTLTTANSTFDTLLGVYTLERGSDPPLARLREVAADDDYGGLFTSYVQFGANANSTYEIAVDGFNGATGDISLQLNFLSSSNLQPTVVQRPGDRALRLGDPLILSMRIVPSPNLQFRWYLNGSPISGLDDDSTHPTLLIPSLQRTNLGFYALKFFLNDDSFFSTAVEIQVNSEGQEAVLARNKMADAAQSGLTGGLMLGYNGTQIFNTTNAVVDTNAPSICGVPPGAAYWFSYQAPTNGTLTLDTVGSSFPTLLAVFTYSGVLYSYTNLVLVTCDNNSGGAGTNTSSVQFNTTNGGNYFVVVGGVNGARGLAHLNYLLTPGLPNVVPTVTSSPQPLMVAEQTAVALIVAANGSPPLSYQWWKDNYRLRSQTNASLLLRSPSRQDSGKYTVVVTNAAGAITSAPASVVVMSPPLVNYYAASNCLVSVFPGIRGYQYAVDCASNLAPGAWWSWTNAFPDYGGLIWITNNTTGYDALLVRVHAP